MTVQPIPVEAERQPPAAVEAVARFGLELEYGIVDGETLDVAPVADELLDAVGHDEEGSGDPEPAWTHRLPRHVVALRGVAAPGGARALQHRVALACRELERRGLRLMPSGMHPWMDPARELSVWSGAGGEPYAALARLIDPRQHGIANALGATLALPFAGDEEFVRIHTAVRLLLPILPGLAASSPLVGGERTGILDNRLVLLRAACAREPLLAGQIVPEPVGSLEEYRDRVLEPLYAALAPHDPDGLLRDERINLRGAVVRLDAQTVEIRALDAQEAPAMDAACAVLVAAVVRLLADEQWADERAMRAWQTESLARLLARAARDAERAEVGERRYLAALGFAGGSATLRRLWEHLAEQVDARTRLDDDTGRALEHYLRHGSLATRLAEACGLLPSRAAIARVYERLCDALALGEPFAPPAPR